MSPQESAIAVFRTADHTAALGRPRCAGSTPQSAARRRCGALLSPTASALRRTAAPTCSPCRSTLRQGARACASGGLLRLSARVPPPAPRRADPLRARCRRARNPRGRHNGLARPQGRAPTVRARRPGAPPEHHLHPAAGRAPRTRCPPCVRRGDRSATPLLTRPVSRQTARNDAARCDARGRGAGGHALGLPPRQTHSRARAIRHRRVRPRAWCASMGWVRRRVWGVILSHAFYGAPHAHTVRDGHSFHCRADARVHLINFTSSTHTSRTVFTATTSIFCEPGGLATGTTN